MYSMCLSMFPQPFPFLCRNNRVSRKPRRFTGGPFLVRSVRVYALHALGYAAIMPEHSKGEVPARCGLSGNLALPLHLAGNIRQAANVLVGEPCVIRYAFIPGAQRRRTSVKILAIHIAILCPGPSGACGVSPA